MRRAGAEVTEASSGEQALMAVLARVPDIVLMDISMPGMDGHEALARLRAAGYHDLPVIALSASARSRPDTDAEGPDDFSAWLIKPVRREPLVAAIAAASGRERTFSSDPESPRKRPEVFDEALFRTVEQDVGSEIFGTLVESFLTEAEERRQAIRLAASADDFAYARLNAHALKSAAGSFGAMRLAAESEILERLSESATASAFKAAIAEFEAALDEAIGRIRDAYRTD